MTKLNYPSIAALLADFTAGAKFEITGAEAATPGPVLRMLEDKGGVRVFTTTSYSGTVFNIDGSWGSGRSSVYLTKTVAAPAAEPRVPFLKRVVLGESAYCPKTREVVEAVVFRTNALEVVLRNEDGVTRVSTNYDHEGKHKWIRERSLVIGNLPPVKQPPAAAYLFRDRLGNLHAVERLKTVPPGWKQVGFSLLQG